MSHDLIHLATRVFGIPLMVERARLDVILAVLGPRLGLAEVPELTAQTGEEKQYRLYQVTTEGIAVIDVLGTLAHRSLGVHPMSGLRTYLGIGEELAQAVADPSVRGILLDVDSGGGEVAGAFELAEQIHQARQLKPVWAVADPNALSAGYLLASAAQKVYVAESGSIGSVGIIALHVDESQADAARGLKYTAIYAGKRKNDFTPHEPLSDEARNVLQAEVNRLQAMFVRAVARYRGIDARVVRNSEARIYFGGDGVEAGFADQVGTIEEALGALTEAVDARTKISFGAKGEKKMIRAESDIPNEDRQETEDRAVENPPDADVEPTPVEEVTELAEVAAEQPAPTESPAESMAVPMSASASSRDGVPAIMVAFPIDEAAQADLIREAAEIAELCHLAGQSAKAAGFIRAMKPLAEVRTNLLEARAAEDARTEIHSHALPETAAVSGWEAKTTGKTEDSPIVQAAEKLAQAARKEK